MSGSRTAGDIEPPQAGSPQPRQIVYYDDGVGTENFKPLAALGGRVLRHGRERAILQRTDPRSPAVEDDEREREQQGVEPPEDATSSHQVSLNR